MSAETLSLWLLSIMLSAVPPGKSRFPDAARESAEEGRSRYAAIAKAVAEVSLDPKESPLFDGKRARLETAALLLAISYHESHWRRDVDLGIGAHARGAGGRYHCMMQIAVDDGRTPEGWTAEQLVKSRLRCFRRGLHILQRGRRHCAVDGRYAFVLHYASGYCDRGAKAVAKRVRTHESWLRDHPFPLPGASPKRSSRARETQQR